jgi:hypothetical protein
MTRKYDLQDEWDRLQMYGDYDNISATAWQEYITFTQLPVQKKSFSFEERVV